MNGMLINPNGNTADLRVNSHGYIYYPTSIYFKSLEDRKRSYVNVCIHRYQAFKKYGTKIFEDGIIVRHRNNDKLDNSWDNVLIGTTLDNYNDNPILENQARLENYNSSMTNKTRNKNKEKWRSIYKDRELGMSYNDLIKKHNISKASLSYHFGSGEKAVNKEYIDLINSTKSVAEAD